MAITTADAGVGRPLRGRVTGVAMDAALTSGMEFVAGPQQPADVTVDGLLDTAVFVGDVLDLPRGQVRVVGPAGIVGFRAVVTRVGKIDEGHEFVLTDVDPVGISVADVRRILDLGPEAAGYQVDRILLARHLFPERG